MGSSSKKHKSEKRKKRSRSPDRERERHRSHKRHKSRRQEKYEGNAEPISSDSSDVEEVCVIPPPPPKISSPEPESVVSGGRNKESLSIEETNALRAKLGLKPLQVDGNSSEKNSGEKRIAEDGSTMGEFVHKPPINLADKMRTEKIRAKLAERKEKRAIEEKLKATKGLAESDSDDNVEDWVKKNREKEQQKKDAEKRAKMLEELDREFGIGDLVEEQRVTERRALYSTRDLRGLRVGHAVDGFLEGSNVILTLKDKGVLEEEPDTLVNVNMIDNERYKKNVERKKKPTLEDDMDIDPFEQKKSILAKYDEEIDGEKEESFALGSEMSEIDRIRQKIEIRKKLNEQKSAVDLSMDLRLASDYYTEEEVSAKFKRPGKFKKLRKKPKMLKADDLMPKQDVAWPTEDLGCRRRPRIVSHDDLENGDVKMDIVKEEIEPVLDVDDLPAVPDDLYKVKIDPDEAELELQLALNKARKVKQKEPKDNPIEKIAKEIIESGNENNPDGPGGTIVLNSTAEFCRTLGDIPTYGLSGNRDEAEEDLLDFEKEMKEENKRWEDERKNRGAWSQVESDVKVEEPVPEEVPILDEEPDLGKGIAGALQLALSKGYLEKETLNNRPSASRFAHLQAQNYSIEDKTHNDDDKFGRRERFTGPTSEFKEKEHYKPNVKLDYIDDEGRKLNEKEAFRYLSHKFHGKGPGKNKVEKRMKKNEQEGLMKQMSSTDTPLRTLTMLQQKQKETQSPFVILSGKGLAGSSSSISKLK